MENFAIKNITACALNTIHHTSIHFVFIHRILLGIPKDANNLIGHSRCSMYAVNFTQILIDGVQKADPKWPIVPCQHGWEFDTNEIPYSTISTEVSNFP